MATRSTDAPPGRANWSPQALLMEARERNVPGTGNQMRWFFSGVWLVYLLQPASELFRQHDPARIAAREKEYKEKFANPFIAGHRGFIEDVIMPRETRKRLCRSLAMLRDKKLENPWRKHGNIPL